MKFDARGEKFVDKLVFRLFSKIWDGKHLDVIFECRGSPFEGLCLQATMKDPWKI